MEFCKLYDNGKPLEEIKLKLGLSDKQIRKLCTELFIDKYKPIMPRNPDYELIKLTKAFKKFFPDNYFSSDYQYVKAELFNGEVRLTPYYNVLTSKKI